MIETPLKMVNHRLIGTAGFNFNAFFPMRQQKQGAATAAAPCGTK
jgi:hypothetical protein